MKFVMDLRKANRIQDADGVLTPYGSDLARQYAAKWIKGIRATDLEDDYPELQWVFFDIRNDPDFLETLL